MFWIQIVTKFIKILRAGQTPAQIAGGFALGALVGFSPSFTLQALCIWLIIFVLDVNLSSAFLAFTLCTLFAYLLDPVFHHFGYYILTDIPSLKSIWTTLYNVPIAPLTRFNNTIVMGSFLSAIILFFPIYFGMKNFVIAYRERLHTKIEKMKIYQIISKNSLVKAYVRMRDWKENL